MAKTGKPGYKIGHTGKGKTGGTEIKSQERSAEATRTGPKIIQKDLNKLDALSRKKGVYGAHYQKILGELRTYGSCSTAIENIRNLRFEGKGVSQLDESHLAAIENLLKNKGWK